MTHGQVGPRGGPWFKLGIQEHVRRTFLRPGPQAAPWMQDPAPKCWTARLGLTLLRQSIMILMAGRNGWAQGGIRVDAHNLPGRSEHERRAAERTQRRAAERRAGLEFQVVHG